MERRLRYLPREGSGLVEVTCRTLQGRFLLTPSTQLNEIILGALGRAQELYPVAVGCRWVPDERCRWVPLGASRQESPKVERGGEKYTEEPSPCIKDVPRDLRRRRRRAGEKSIHRTNHPRCRDVTSTASEGGWERVFPSVGDLSGVEYTAETVLDVQREVDSSLSTL
jgi:hypothetical protein